MSPRQSRFKLSEITPRRASEAVWRRIAEIPHLLVWKSQFGYAHENRARLAAFHDLHQGERCFILGNGPSLSKMDLSCLKGEVTFGLNRIYMMFDQVGLEPTYYVCINELVLEQFADEIHSLSMPKFLNWNRRGLFNLRDESTMFLRARLGLTDDFEKDPGKAIYTGGTVTYVAIQLAFHMGFRQVVLIGVDHYYRDRGVPNTVAIRQQERDSDHFHPEYFPKGSKWQPPDLLRSEIAYRIARLVFEKDSRQIVDATLAGQCPVFTKVSYSSLFS